MDLASQSARSPVEDTSLLSFYIRAHTLYFTCKNKHIAVQHRENEKRVWKMQIWTGFFSLLSHCSLLFLNCDSIVPTGTEAWDRWGFRSKGSVTSQSCVYAPKVEYGCCCRLWRTVWSPRCNPMNIMSAHFILWMGQHKRKQKKKKGSKLLLLNGRLPEIRESTHWHNISSLKGEFQAKILHLLQLCSQSASRFPLSDMWPSYLVTQESSCRCSRCRLTAVAGSLVLKASL